jgi:type II secretory pathway component GspD/PulD (secretin)
MSGQAPVEGRLQPLPLTQLEERALGADLDNRTFSLTFAQPVPVRDLLLQLARGTSLSIIPDPAIEGTFMGELKNVTVRQALGLILPPIGLDYHVESAFIRVGKREPETRLFDVNYLAFSPSGSTTIGGSSAGGRTATVSASTTADVFAEIAGGVKMLLSPAGVFNVDRKAGLVQVTDFPERLDRIALYLDTVHRRVHRQVQIDLRIIEVELNDADAEMLDWAAIATGAGPEGAAPARGNVVGLRVSGEPALTTIRETDTVARVADGETLVLGGFTRQRETRQRQNAGTRGGWFGRSTVVTRKRVELVILLTPRILRPVGAP